MQNTTFRILTTLLFVAYGYSSAVVAECTDMPTDKDGSVDWSGCEVTFRFHPYLDTKENTEGAKWPVYLKNADLTNANVSGLVVVGKTGYNHKNYVELEPLTYRDVLPPASMNYSSRQYDTTSTLEEISFENATLGSAVLISGISMPKAKFSNATLNFASFHFCDLTEAEFRETVINGVDFTGSILTKVELKEMDLTNMKLAATPGGIGVVMNEATMEKVNLRGVDMTGISLQQATITESQVNGFPADAAAAKEAEKTIFNRANLAYATFTVAEFTDIDAKQADLRGLNLQGAILENVDFSNSFLQGANLADTTVKNVTFTKADLSLVNFRGMLLDRYTWDQLDEKTQHIWKIMNNSQRDFLLSLQTAALRPLDRMVVLGTNMQAERAKKEEEQLPGEEPAVYDPEFCKRFNSCYDVASGKQMTCPVEKDETDSDSDTDTQNNEPDLPVPSGQTMLPLPNRIIPKPIGSCIYTPPLIDAEASVPRDAELDLVEANLTGADLRLGRLKQTPMRGAWLMGADARGADLEGADLRGANLASANFAFANLKNAQLQNANLSGTDFRGANLSGANLLAATIDAATNLNGTLLFNATWTEEVDELQKQGDKMVRVMKQKCDEDAVGVCSVGVYRLMQQRAKAEKK